ncbi:MAG: inactive transglutaminase family protein [Lentisphaeraceae bacterium]|nr:inactive transglutaminase family protein [Lentisphaeraceae bacterium]
MSAKAQVYAWAIVLTIIGIVLIAYKNMEMGIPLAPGKLQNTWVVESIIEFDADGGPVKAKMTLPGYFSNFEVLNKYGASEGYGYTVDQEGERQTAVWSARDKVGPQKIYYRFSMFDTEKKAELDPTAPGKLTKPHFSDVYVKAINSLVESSWRTSADAKTFVIELIKRVNSKQPTQNTMLIKELITSKYPLERLIRDMVRHKDIHAKIIRGLKVEDAKRKVAAETFLSIYDKEKWNVVNLNTLEFGIPNDVVFWGPYPLLEVEGARNSKISFSMLKNKESAQALAIRNNLNKNSTLLNFSIYTLPLEHQNVFKLLLLIPFGCLVVVIIRNLVGMPTSGTFMPVLLAMAFIETTLIKGLVILSVVLLLGLLIRFYLSRLNLLLVPRISAVVISVVMLMAFISVISFKLGFDEGISVTLFPMIIISWTIERVSILWEEQGGQEVFSQMGGSLVVSIMIYFVMTNSYVQYFTFSFPESLFVLLALVLMAGTYTGYRLTELTRFEPLVKED